MPALVDRPFSALVIVDPQIAVTAHTFERGAVLTTIGRLIEKARFSGTDIFWTQHGSMDLARGSDGWKLIPELGRREWERIIHKRYPDAFEGTNLDALLENRGIGHLYVCGFCSDSAIRATLHGAFLRGYDVTLVGDAHTLVDSTAFGAPEAKEAITFTNLYWKNQEGPERAADTLPSTRVTFL